MSRLTQDAEKRLRQVARQLNVSPEEVVRRGVRVYDFLVEKAREGDEDERLIANILLGRRRK